MRAPAWFVVIALCVSIGSGSIVSAQKKDGRKAKGKPDVEIAQLAWPLPPEQPRVRYLATYRGLDDFKPAKKPSRLMTLMLGQADPSASLSDSMLKPYGIAVGPSGRVYVSDTAARRVFAFDRDQKTVGFVGEGKTGRLTKPMGVAVDGRAWCSSPTPP